MFKYEKANSDSKVTVFFNGDLDIDVTEVIEDELTPQLQSGEDTIVLDFDKVSFVDSSGIGLLITLISTLQEQGKNVAIQNVSSEVMMVFSLLQLPDILGREVFVD